MPARPPGLNGVQWLALLTAVNGVTTNVNLFIFNVFFPMYPMDSAKIVVCTLQLWCKCGYRKVAWVLVCLSGLAGGGMIARTLYGKVKGGGGGGNVNANLPMMLAMMSLVETVRIYQMLKKDEVHRHPLFAGADQEPELETFTRAPDPPPRNVVPVNSSGLLGGAGTGSREAFLDRLQQQSEEGRMTVRELEIRESSRR